MLLNASAVLYVYLFRSNLYQLGLKAQTNVKPPSKHRSVQQKLLRDKAQHLVTKRTERMYRN